MSEHQALDGVAVPTPAPVDREVTFADLGLAPSTVKTYRNRAFARLGIHSRHALFALATQG